MAEGGVIGKFMSYYEEARSFTDEERELAIMIARQVGFCLERTRSERKREAVEHDLRDSEERFRAMSDLAPVMMWISDDQGACLHLNRMLREFWGVDEAKIAGFDWRTRMHPADALEISARIKDAIVHRNPVQIKGRYLKQPVSIARYRPTRGLGLWKMGGSSDSPASIST
jgi:PAS domain-containing protein